MPRTSKTWRRVGKAPESGPYAKHMPRALSEATIKYTSDHQSLVGAYAQHEITSWLHGLKVSLALSICRAYTKKKTQLAQDSLNANIEDDEESDNANHDQNDEKEEEEAEERSDEENVSESL